MFTFVIILLIVVSILLGLVVLVQNSKGGGLASGFSASNQIMGVRKTSDLLEKLTWGFAGALIVLALLGNFVLPKNATKQNQSLIQKEIDNTSAPQMPQAPAQGAGAPANGGGQPAPAPAAPAK